MLFVHGLGCRRQFFDAVIDELAPHFDCLAMDLSHHGESGAVPGPVSIARFADDVRAVLLAAGVTRVVLVGHSLGAAVCVEAAVRPPRAMAPAATPVITQVVALDALINPRVYPRQPAVVVALSRAVSRLMHPLMMRLLLRALMPAPRNAALYLEIATSMLALPAPVAADASASLAAWDRDAAVRTAAVPISMLPADAFYRPRETAALLERFAPFARLFGPVAGGHFYLRERPAATAAIIREAIESTSREDPLTSR